MEVQGGHGADTDGQDGALQEDNNDVDQHGSPWGALAAAEEMDDMEDVGSALDEMVADSANAVATSSGALYDALD